MKVNGAEIICRVLLEQKVETVFGYPGGAVLHIYDALYQHREKIKHYITAHEQGAAHAADGFARASGKTGVVIATSGPGATNLVTGIATAYMDSVPMVVITGNVSSGLIGKDSFQEVYTMGITMPITKHNYTVNNIENLADVLREAFMIAGSGRKGPVLVDVTKDVAMAECEYEPQPAFSRQVPPFENEKAIEKIQRQIARAKRPVVCFGGGVAAGEAGGLLYEMLHKTNIPAVHTLMAAGVLSWDDPLNLGLVGMHGSYSANKVISQADMILAAGFRFSDRVALNTDRFGRKAKIVQIDIDESEINKNVQVDYAVVGDIAQVLAKLVPVLESGQHDDWLETIAEWKQKDYRPTDSAEVLKPHQIIDVICKMAGEDSLIVTDVGQHQMWTAQFLRRTMPRSFLTSGGLGTMGFGYGAAIGASVAAAPRRVIHITGDGSFHMNMNEACTAVSYGIPVVSVILNNNVLGMVRQWQYAFYEKRYSNTTLERKTDYAKVAEGFGLKGFKAETLAEFADAFAKALACGGPAWVEAVIDRDERVVPMIPSGGTVDDIVME